LQLDKNAANALLQLVKSTHKRRLQTDEATRKRKNLIKEWSKPLRCPDIPSG
jgi:hypothetical protein